MDRVGPAARLWWLARRAAVLVYQENCLAVSKGAAYSALLSLFPVLTTIAAILVQLKARPVLGVLSALLEQVAPPGTEEMLLARFAVQGTRPVSLLVAATLLSLYAASGVMFSLMEGFNNVYHVPVNRTFFRNRGVAALLVFVTALPAVGASALILFGTRTERAVLSKLTGQPAGDSVLLAGEITRYVIALATVVLVTAALYHIGTHRAQKWRNVWPGAVAGTLLWLVATQAFAWYVRNMAGYNVFYGSVGAVLSLLVWMYLLALIALYGCAFNAARERLLEAEAHR
jgi:membrane protein